MRLPAVLFAAVLFLPVAAQAEDNGCSFAAPMPVLQDHAYAGQKFTPKPENAAVETAALGGGVTLTINHYQCVDVAEHDFVLTVPNDPKIKRDFAAWASFTQAALRGLKVRHAESMTELLTFLEKAGKMTPKDGAVTVCRNGKVQNVCDWDSLGTLRFEVKPGAKSTTLTAVIGLSG